MTERVFYIGIVYAVFAYEHSGFVLNALGHNNDNALVFFAAAVKVNKELLHIKGNFRKVNKHRPLTV